MTSDDEKLLRDLGRFVHRQERTPEQALLEKLSSGELARNEEAALEARAAGDSELARALSAHAPLSTDVKAQIAARALAAARVASAREDTSADDAVEPEPVSKPEPSIVETPSVIELRRWQRKRALWTAAPLLAAAGALLWFSTAGKQVAALPEYALQVAGAEAEVRATPAPMGGVSEDQAPVRVGPGTRLRIALRPATAIGDEVSAAVYWVAGADAQAWPAAITKAESGALQLVLSPPPAALAPQATAVILVARPELLSAHGAELARDHEARGPGFQRWRVPLLPARSHD